MTTPSRIAQKLWRLLQAGCALQVVLLIAMAASCQGSHPTSPTAENPQTPTQFPTAIPPGLVVEDTASDGSITGQGVLGAYRFILDPEKQTASLEPIARAGDALGDPFTADITGLLSGNPCNDCFKVNSVGKTPDGYVYADYELRHPFPLPSHNPPQFGDRIDLHVYDVRGIFLKPDPGDTQAMHEYADLMTVGSTPEPLIIDNSGFLAGITIDGQTSAFDAYTDTFYPTQANAHPYVMMHEDTRITNFDPGTDNGWTDLYDPIGHNVFPQGGGPFTKRVVFTAAPGETVEYLVLLAANFASSAQGNGLALGKRGNPAYYLPWANMKSPWRVRVEETSNTLEAGNSTSDARLRVTIYDWQHHLGVLTTVDEFKADNQSRNSLLRPSRVLDIEGSIPGVAPMSEVNSGFLMGTGTPQSPLIYEVVCPNTLEAEAGTYLGALAIRDEYTAGETPEGFGKGFTPFVLDDYTTYVTFVVQVAPAAGGGSTPFLESAQVFGGNMPNPNPDALETLNLDNGTLGNLGIYSKVGLPNEYVFAATEFSGFTANVRSQIAVSASSNGGISFGLPSLMPPDHDNDQQKEPTLLVIEDSLSVPWLHLAWAARDNNGDFDIYYTRSSDLGTTWMPVERAKGGGENQISPCLGANPLNARDIFLAMEETGSKSRIRLLRDADGDGDFEQEIKIDEASNGTLNRRVNPAFVFPPASAGVPNTFALVYRRSNGLGPDIVVTSTTTGYAGLGIVSQGVSNESATQIAVDPSALYALGPSGLDLLVAFNEQSLLTVVNPLGGNIITISASQLQVARKRAGQPAFDVPVDIGDTDNITSASTPALLRANDDLGHAVFVIWSDNRGRYTSGHDIFQATSADRGATWTNDLLLIGSTGNQRNPSLARNVAGDLRLLYRDENRKPREMIRLARGEE